MSEEDRTRRDILDAALAAFGTHGYRATSLVQIASAAKVSRPTLYSRYPDKRALFRAVFAGEAEDALEAAKRATRAEGGFEERLAGVLLAYYGQLFDRFHGLPRLDELTLVQSAEAEDLVEAARERFRGVLASFLRAAGRAGDIDVSQLDLSLPQLVELIRQAPQSLKTPSTTRAQYRRGLRRVAQLYARALAP